MPDTPRATRPAALRFTLPCELSHVRLAAQAVHQFLAEQGCDEEMLTACDLALVEACNNAIKYAPANARTQPVCVEVLCDAEQLEIRVVDHTAGFEWPKQIDLPPPESESGRGLFLIHSLMDDACYLRGNNENVLVLRKKRTTPPPKSETATEALKDDAAPMADLLDELTGCYESLAAIFRHGADFSKTNDVRKFARRMLAELSQIVGAEWFVFRTIEHHQSRLDALAASESALELLPILFRGENGDAGFLESQVALSQQAIWFDENYELSPADPLRLKPKVRGLVCPVFAGDSFVGTLAIGKGGGRYARPLRTSLFPKENSTGQTSPETTLPGRAIPGIFTRREASVIHFFSQFLGIQVANARVCEENLTNRIIARELEIAGSIQRSLLLKELPELKGFEFAALCRSAHQVGGDFYDVLKLSEDTALLVIADVMGKGVLAAMFAAILRAVLRATPELNREPGTLLARVNELLFDELSNVDMFITAQLAFVDARQRKMIVGSAGHCPLLLANGFGVNSLSPEGMPLGILPDTIFTSETADLPPNSHVLLYTDGLTEAMSATGERYGQERLTEWFKEAHAQGRPANELQEELASKLAQFQLKTGLNDDQTFLIMAGKP